ncbi:MAG: SPOR domain-containing protein [Hyphomicrobiales bacterium]|nr:SPOR domain-containing protein [Hyphomicrobiales bacterium]
MADQEEPPELGRLPDNSVLWRASLWGGAAIVALASAILITQTDIGSQRLQLVFGSEPAPARVVTQADFVAQPDADMQRRETARLEAQVRELAADRERLTARIATLEQNLSDVTGSLKRELAAAAARPAPPAPTVAAPMTAPPARLEPIGKADGKSANKSPAPEEAKQDNREPEEDPKTAEALAAAAKAAATLPQIAATQTTAPQVAEPPVAETQVAAAQSSEPQVAPPLGEPIPLPPMPIAGATPGELSHGGNGREVGIDLGGARSLEIMQARWAAVKANFGPLLNGLRPLVARDTRPHMTPYRLIVGPLPNAAAAAQVCARFAASRVTCRATKFAGAQLTVPQ